jgi:mono/diheme cytochrome c family protein
LIYKFRTYIIGISATAWIAFFFACGNGSGTSSQPKTPIQLYKRYCSNCHGIDGNLSISGASKLRYSTMSLEERVWIITNGRNTMTGFNGKLSEAEIRQLAEFTLQLAEHTYNAR